MTVNEIKKHIPKFNVVSWVTGRTPGTPQMRLTWNEFNVIRYGEHSKDFWLTDKDGTTYPDGTKDGLLFQRVRNIKFLNCEDGEVIVSFDHSIAGKKYHDSIIFRNVEICSEP